MSMEFPWPGDETSDDAELETRVWPLAENKETAGETGVEAVNGDWGGWREGGDRSPMASIETLSRRFASTSCESLSIVRRDGVLEFSGRSGSGS